MRERESARLSERGSEIEGGTAYNGQAEVVAYFLDEDLFPTGAESAQMSTCTRECVCLCVRESMRGCV